MKDLNALSPLRSFWCLVYPPYTWMWPQNFLWPLLLGRKVMTNLLLLSRFNHVQLCVTPRTVAHQAASSMGFSRQEHWSGLQFPSPMTNTDSLDSTLKSSDITLSTKVHLVKAMVFPVVMYGCELDYKESWALKNWCFWAGVLGKTLESPLDCKEIQPVHPKGNQSWMFIGRTDAEAEAPILWPPDAKSRLIWKDPDAGKDWGQEEKGMMEDEMVGWHHQLDGHEFE